MNGTAQANCLRSGLRPSLLKHRQHIRHHFGFWFHSLIALAVNAFFSSSLLAGPDFTRDIQPIFSTHCYECHGAEKQKGKLRLDDRNSALKRGGAAVITPGNAARSDLYRRIKLRKGDEDIMPNRGEPLSKVQTDLIRDWINAGAVWPENAAAARHWAYVLPTRPPSPRTKAMRWARNEIDSFILARLEARNLRVSPEADRVRLLRRVYLDLIGLPPSPRELETFLADRSADAYEKTVDALLQSPHYGERWARPWLDLARYADSLGFQRDDLWSLWPYRDWVIKALNDDMPFDRFTVEQIAGDLLPDAALEQKVATGFNRCATTNVEAGSDQEETRVNQIFDRVNTLGTVWLGLTLECAQCHNHKYDPLSQKEYYQLFAFFNNTPQETDFTGPQATATLRFLGPYLNLPADDIESKRIGLQAEIKELDQRFKAANDSFLAGPGEWEKKLAGGLPAAAQAHVLEAVDFETESGSFHETLEDKSILVHNNDNAAVPDKDTYTITVHTKLTEITGFKLEVLSDASLPDGRSGRGDERPPGFALTEFAVNVRVAGEPGAVADQPVVFRNARASFSQKDFPAAHAIDADSATGWAINPESFKDQWAIFDAVSPTGSRAGRTFIFKLEQNLGRGRTLGRLRLSALTGNADAGELPADVVKVIATPAEQRTKPQQTRLINFYLSQQPELVKMKGARAKLEGQLKNLQPPRTLVVQELETPRSTTTFVRGNFLEKDEPVQPNVPAALPPLPEGPRNRLTLARWLANTNSPLVARVAVNRWWAEFFGHGLVTTPEDFGSKGELPTHPELLDWLAVEFMEHGWSVKHIHRLIVTSATYRQSSTVRPRRRELDDRNKLYTRGPRLRMDAEMIRDNALAAAGLLSFKMGGRPVRPYQPPGIWENKVGGDRVSYDISEGEDRHRRGIYTVWKRTSPYPSFINFDAPNRNTCVVERPRSNTPLQSLTLLNDPVYVEAARALARRVLTEKASVGAPEKIRYAFRLCTSRTPTPRELEILMRLYQTQLQASRKDAAAANKLFHDDSSLINVNAAEFAAWYSVASALLNLDETITKS